MKPALNIAIKAARRAGDVILRNLSRVQDLKITTKNRNDFVTEVDHLAEREIIQTIHRAYPGHGIMAEESGKQQGDDHLWIIDPLDGTTNFIHGFPQFAVSIALRIKEHLDIAVVFDPTRNELFTAARGSGAYLNDRRIRVSKTKTLEGALLGTGFPFKYEGYLDTYLKTFKALLQPTAGIRRAGSAALDLSYVACGRLDGFWEIGLKPWDMAGGILMIQEAGGLISDFAGGDTYFTHGNIVAANPRIHTAMVDKIQPCLGDELER